MRSYSRSALCSSSNERKNATGSIARDGASPPTGSAFHAVETLLHERVHVLQKLYPVRFASLYRDWGYLPPTPVQARAIEDLHRSRVFRTNPRHAVGLGVAWTVVPICRAKWHPRPQLCTTCAIVNTTLCTCPLANGCQWPTRRGTPVSMGPVHTATTQKKLPRFSWLLRWWGMSGRKVLSMGGPPRQKLSFGCGGGVYRNGTYETTRHQHHHQRMTTPADKHKATGEPPSSIILQTTKLQAFSN